ncbi:MAG: hypothetical protein NVSMB33_05690 [Ktedonobacteraceae bacterium]
MATMTVGSNSYNVTVQSIQSATSSTGGSSFNANSTYAATGVALASPGQLLTVQVGIENYRGDPDTCTIQLTDPYGNQSFQGVATISWNENDTSTVWVQFSGFPLQADQSTPMDKCNYSIAVLNIIDNSQGTDVNAQVYTL